MALCLPVFVMIYGCIHKHLEIKSSRLACFDVSVYLILHRDPSPAQCKKLQKEKTKKKKNLIIFAPLYLKFHMALLLSCLLFRLQILFFYLSYPTTVLFFLTWMYEFRILISAILIIFKFSSIILLENF